MKNFMGRMVGPSFGISFDGEAAAGGGGAAVAAPAAAGASGGSGGATGGGAGAGGGGSSFSFFHGAPQRETASTAAKSDEKAGAGGDGAGAAGAAAIEKPYIVNDDNGKPIEGAAFATKEEAEEYIKTHGTGTQSKTGDAGAAEKTAEEIVAEEIAAIVGGKPKEGTVADGVKVEPEAVLEKPIFGRFKTIKETEEYIKQSGTHAQRLDAENKQLKADAAAARETREAEVASLKAELELVRNTPPFKELTAEEYEKLDADAKVDYKFAKRDHDEKVQKAKDEAARAVHDQKARLEASKSEIQRLVKEMEADKETYPMFREVDPIMGKIYESLGGKDSPLANDPRAVNLLYLAARGVLYNALEKKGKVAKTEATEAAKKAAAAAAAASSGAGAGAGAAGGKEKTKAEIEKERFSKAIKDAGPKRFLNI